MSSDWLPKAEVSLDTHSPLFWDQGELDYETRRQFDVCHSCRLCFNLCEYFPKMFEYIDQAEGQDVKKLTHEQLDEINGYASSVSSASSNAPTPHRTNTPSTSHAWRCGSRRNRSAAACRSSRAA